MDTVNQHAVLLGRNIEDTLIRTAVRDSADRPQALAFTGDAGIGKSTLLRHAAGIARAAGFRIIAARATPTGSAQRSLMAALLAAARTLPEALRAPLEHWLARTPAAPGPVPLRMAVLAVVEHLTRLGPVLITVDHGPEDDTETAAVLMFAVRRLRRGRLILLFAARAEISGGVTGCPVPPLSETAAAGLVDSRPVPPTGWVRAEILRFGAGNPLALTELADAAATGARPDLRIGVTGRLARMFAAALARLPGPARRILLVAATAEDDDANTVLAGAGAALPDCRPAEEAGLISVVAGRLLFRHPMIRATCYLTATPDERRDAHTRLAALLPPHSAGRDWHLANANAMSSASSDEAGRAFERAAEGVTGGQRGLEAAALLERAAEHSREPGTAARRYALAAAEADRCGDVAWTAELWARTTALTDDPAVLGPAVAALGNMGMFRPAGPTLALADRLLTPQREAPLLAMAARAVLTDGDPADLPALRRLIARAGRNSGPDDHGVTAVKRALAAAVADPASWTDRYGPLRDSPLLQPLPGPAERLRLLSVAGIAWVLDDTDIAVDHYRRALDMIRRDRSLGVSAIATVAVTEVLFDLGMFDAAAAELGDAADLVGGNRANPLRRAVAAQQVTLLTRRGELDRARRLLDQVGEPDPQDTRLVRYLLHRAAGQLAAAEGDHQRACTAFLRVFAADGSSLHYLLSQRSVVELAASAVAAGRQPEVLSVLRRARARVAFSTARRDWSWDVAVALLSLDADPGAEQRLSHLLAAPAGTGGRPYDHGVAEVCYAEALRTHRRPVEARPLLASALDEFVRFGAVHDSALVREKMRATGVRAQYPGEATFAALSAQHQRIARLAGDGMSNRDIADRLGLSHRTIGFHLYQIYPKLGIARRDQLRDVVPATDMRATAGRTR